MNNHRHYSKFRTESKVFAIFMAVFLTVLIVLGVLDLCGVFDPPRGPDVVIPMTNAMVGWQETFYPGGWT